MTSQTPGWPANQMQESVKSEKLRKKLRQAFCEWASNRLGNKRYDSWLIVVLVELFLAMLSLFSVLYRVKIIM